MTSIGKGSITDGSIIAFGEAMKRSQNLTVPGAEKLPVSALYGSFVRIQYSPQRAQSTVFDFHLNKRKRKEKKR